MASNETIQKWNTMLASGTITPETYNSMVSAAKLSTFTPTAEQTTDWDSQLASGAMSQERYANLVNFGVVEGFTPWGTKITDGRTTAQVAADNIAKTQATVANQLASYGYKINPSDIPLTGSSYNVGAGGNLTPVQNTPVVQPATTGIGGTQVANPNAIATNNGLPVTKNMPASSDPTYQAYLEAEKAIAINELDFARQQALSNLQAEKAQIAPFYYDERNAYAAQSALARRAEQERMAAQGLLGGVSTQGEIARGVAQQGALSALGRDEAEAYADIARRTSDVQNQYQFGVADLASQMRIEQMKYDLEQQKLAEQEAKAQEESDNLDAEFNTMLSSADPYAWLMSNQGRLGPETSLYLYKYLGTLGMLPEAVSGSVTETVTPEQNVAFNKIATRIMSDTSQNANVLINTLRGIRQSGVSFNPNYQDIVASVKQLSDSQFENLLLQIPELLNERATNEYNSAVEQTNALVANAEANAKAYVENVETQIYQVDRPLDYLQSELDNGNITQATFNNLYSKANTRQNQVIKAEQDEFISEVENNALDVVSQDLAMFKDYLVQTYGLPFYNKLMKIYSDRFEKEFGYKPSNYTVAPKPYME